MVFTLMTGVYLHTAYAQASDGSVGFSTTSATDAAYLGQYTDASAADATDPGRYAWTPIDLGAGAELVEAAGEEVDDGTDGLIDLLDRELYDTGQFAPDAQATGDRKVQTYFQPDEPDPEKYVFGVGDLWHDTDDGNHLYRWDGTAWVDAQDGGIGAATELAQAADDKATAADEKAQAVKTALDGLTLIQDGQVLIDSGKLYVDTEFVNSLFARDITAQNTITGAKLAGEQIDIKAATTGDFVGGGVQIMSTSEPEVDGDETILPPRFKIYVYGDTSSSLLEMRRNAIGLTSRQVAISAGMQIDIGDPDMTGTMVYLHGHVFLPGGSLADTDYDSTTYTSFSGSVLSSGSVTVTKKLGMCCISGTVALSKSISAWTTILSSSKVPAPQHGELVPFEASQWGTTYARPLRGKITPSGGLQLVYGAAGNYVFTISYPID